MAKYVPPSFKATSFTCMFCEVLTPTIWRRLTFENFPNRYDTPYWTCQCNYCKQRSLWNQLADDNPEIPNGVMILPATAAAPLPHQEIPDDCKLDFNEARDICGRSPRGAAALLRLCLQKLCMHLGGKGKKVDDDIAFLVKKGLAPQIQQALDYVRITGNNAVHPGEISLEESPEHVTVMFEMINLIVEELINRPKQIAEQFAKLPAGALGAIERRDAPKRLSNENGG